MVLWEIILNRRWVALAGSSAAPAVPDKRLQHLVEDFEVVGKFFGGRFVGNLFEALSRSAGVDVVGSLAMWLLAGRRLVDHQNALSVKFDSLHFADIAPRSGDREHVPLFDCIQNVRRSRDHFFK